MISKQLLEILRCPMKPQDVRLEEEGQHLICRECDVKYKIKEGFPCLVVQEAELPTGCESVADLPCQQR